LPKELQLEPVKGEKQHSSLNRAASAITHTHRGELKKAIAQHQQDLATIEGIYEQMNETEQRMKIIRPKLQELEHIKETTGKSEFLDLSDQLSELQTHRKQLLLSVHQWKRMAEDDDDKVKALTKVVAEDRINRCARFITRERRSTSPQAGERRSTLHQAVASGRCTSPDPGERRSTSPQAGVRSTSRRGTSPDPGERKSTSPRTSVRDTACRSISPDSGRNSLTANKFQSIDMD
jgi:hypothetical protein